jgi:2OG-Fe(II) oxygenase superfamily
MDELTSQTSIDCRSKIRRIYRSFDEQKLAESIPFNNDCVDDETLCFKDLSDSNISSRLVCAYHIEQALSEQDLLLLDELRHRIPLDLSRPTCPRRFVSEKHLFVIQDENDIEDTTTKPTHKEDGWIGRLIDDNLARWNVLGHTRGQYFQSLPWFRFLEYSEGGQMAIHTDGSNYHPRTGERSVATMMIYLSTCDDGGETTLYHKVVDTSIKGSDKHNTNFVTVPLEHIAPTRNTVLIFPHSWQHSGDPVRSASQPKIALRVDLCFAPPDCCNYGIAH